MARVVMIVAHEKFRDEELFETKAELESAGHKVAVASTALTPAKGGMRLAKVDLLLDNVGMDFDAIVFVGGSGASQFYTNPVALGLAKKYYTANKVVAAICIAPGILANARILNGKKATVFDDDEYIQMITDNGGKYTGTDVEVSGKIVTANGPQSARRFGKIISSLLPE